MSKEELLFCPLGGSGEIGGNMNLYAYGKENDQKWGRQLVKIDAIQTGQGEHFVPVNPIKNR